MSTRQITLTGRAPVIIHTAEWPRIARAYGECGQYGPGMTPRRPDEYSEWLLVARQHADGRTLVYAVTDDSGTPWGRPLPSGCHDGGELLDAGADIVAAIRRVGDDCGIPDAQIRDAVASLAPERI